MRGVTRGRRARGSARTRPRSSPRPSRRSPRGTRRPDPWRPGAAVSDADRRARRAALARGRLAASSAATRRSSRSPAPPARRSAARFASLAPVDALLGGALKVGSSARYASDGVPLVEPPGGRARARRRGDSDAAAIHGRARRGAGGRRRPSARADGRRATEARVADGRVDRSLDRLPGRAGRGGASARARAHALAARVRRAAVGARAGSADARRRCDARSTGSSLLARRHARAPTRSPTPATRPERAVAICMQVTGALGFTLEFPLQRAYRRSRSARAWADAVARCAWESAG